MEILTTLLAMNLSRAQQIIDIEILTFTTGVKSVALISNNLFDFGRIPIPVIRISIHQPLIHVPEAYIIDLRENSACDDAQHIRRQTHSKILVITHINHMNATNCNKLSFCNAHYLALTADNFVWVNSHNPCRGVGDLKGESCREDMSFMDYPPRILYDGHRMRGVEGLMAETAAQYIGLRVRYVNRHDVEWGHFKPPDGLFGDIATGSSILGFGSLYPTVERSENADMLLCNYPVTLAWVVPIAAGPKKVTWFLVLVSEMTTTVWTSLLISYVFIVVTSWAMCKKDRALVPLQVLALIIGIPQDNLMPRRAAAFVMFFGLIITSCYVSKMSSILTAPAPVPEITTLKQLVDSDLRLFSPTLAAVFFAAKAKALSDNPVMLEIKRKFEPYNDGVEVVLPRVAHYRDCAYCRHGENIAYRAQMDATVAGKIHMLEEPVDVVYPGFLLPKYSCLTPKFELQFNRIYAAGLGIKWARDVAPRIHKPDARGPTVLTLEHIKGYIYVLLTGWGAAIVVFIIEHFAIYLNKKK